MIPFTRSLSVTFVELSEGNGVGGNGKGKGRERRAKELVRSSRAFQGPFASVRSLALSPREESKVKDRSKEDFCQRQERARATEGAGGAGMPWRNSAC